MPRTLILDGPLKGKILQPDGNSFRAMKEPKIYPSHGDPTPIETVEYKVARFKLGSNIIRIAFTCSTEELDKVLWDFLRSRITELKDVTE